MHHVTSCKATYVRCYAYLAALYFYIYFFLQNDRDLLRATAVTREWDGYRNIEHSLFFIIIIIFYYFFIYIF